MKTVFDTDTILYEIIANSSVKTAISGGIYAGDGRPDNSDKEDIVVSTIYLTQDVLPQRGTSNVNIYVSDKELQIKGNKQRKSNGERLGELSKQVVEALRSAQIPGVSLWIDSQNVLPEPAINQHFVNIRVEWNIQKE
jgi:hypothetical protein